MKNIKEINIKNRTYYFFNDMINTRNFDLSLLKIDPRSYKNIDIYYIGYITMKDSDYVKINSGNPLYLIIHEIDGHFKEKNGNKHLILDSTNKNKEVLIKYTKLWQRMKNSIGRVNNKLGEYRKDFTKIKFSSDDNLPLNKTLNFYNITIIIRSVFEEDGKYYPHVFLDECLHEL